MNRCVPKNIHIEYSDKNASSPDLITERDDIVVFLAGPTPAFPAANDMFIITLQQNYRFAICKLDF